MKPETESKLLPLVKKYARIDYRDDDEDILPLMITATAQEMAELIPDFDENNMTARQQLLLLASVKELYDHRDKYGRDQDKLRAAVSSMMLSEMYEAKVDEG